MRRRLNPHGRNCRASMRNWRTLSTKRSWTCKCCGLRKVPLAQMTGCRMRMLKSKLAESGAAGQTKGGAAASSLHLPASLDQSPAQNGEDRKVLFGGHLFFGGDNRFEVEYMDSDSLADVHFIGPREQFGKTGALTDRTEQI